MTGGLEKLSAYVAILITCITSFGWLGLLMYPYAWHKRMSIFYTFDIGLYNVGVGGGVAGHVVKLVAEASSMSDSAKTTLQNLLHGDFGIYDVCSRMCALPRLGGDYCGIWNRLRSGSIALLFMGSIGAILHLLGAFFLYQYWENKATKKTRSIANALLVVPPAIYVISLFQYIMMTWDLVDFPPKTQGGSWGACLMFSIMLTLFSMIPFLITNTVAKRAIDEDLVRAARDLKNAKADAGVELAIRSRREGAEQAAQGGAMPYSGPGYASQDYGSGYAQAPGSGYAPQGPGYAPPSGYSQQAAPPDQFSGYQLNYGQPGSGPAPGQQPAQQQPMPPYYTPPPAGGGMGYDQQQQQPMINQGWG